MDFGKQKSIIIIGAEVAGLSTDCYAQIHLRKTLPGLKNCYMAGQWVEPDDSLHIAVMCDRNVTQIICKKDKKKFLTNKKQTTNFQKVL